MNLCRLIIVIVIIIIIIIIFFFIIIFIVPRIIVMFIIIIIIIIIIISSSSSSSSSSSIFINIIFFFFFFISSIIVIFISIVIIILIIIVIRITISWTTGTKACKQELSPPRNEFHAIYAHTPPERKSKHILVIQEMSEQIKTQPRESTPALIQAASHNFLVHRLPHFQSHRRLSDSEGLIPPPNLLI